jgi:TRAP-type C4-dicarboxylate transport system substrate-binding protein
LNGIDAAEAEALATAEANGMRIHRPDDADREAWQLCTAEVLANFPDESGELGEEVLAAYRRILRTVASQ